MGRTEDPFSEKILAHLNTLDSNIVAIYADGHGSKLPAEINNWRGEYIFCFRSHFILSEKLLAQASVAAINFHPAPPNYRGTGCVNWALYERTETYGTTAHLMTKKIDSGSILNVRRFPISTNDTLQTVLTKTYEHSVFQAKAVIDSVTLGGPAGVQRLIQQASSECWAGKVRTMSELEALYQIPDTADDAEVARIVRATKIGKWAPFRLRDGKKLYL